PDVRYVPARRRLPRLAGRGRDPLAQAGAAGRHAAGAVHGGGSDSLAQQARSGHRPLRLRDAEPARRGRDDRAGHWHVPAAAGDVRTLARRFALAVGLMLALPLSASAAHQTMVLPTLLGEYHLTYDNRKVSEADLKPLVILSPHLAGWNSIAVTPRLERCVV